jgi:predicted MFS family arabinose efflux permease
VFLPFFFLGSYARNVQGLTYQESLNLILVLNGVGIISRLFPSIIALNMGPLNVFMAHVALTAIAIYAWSSVKSTTGLYVWTVFFSLCMGGVQSLAPSALSSVVFDVARQGTLLGMMFTVIGFGALIGPPLSGVLVGGQGGYLGAQMFAGSCMIAGFVVLVMTREVKRRKDFKGFWVKL